jgi:hypothetical protein
MDTKVLPQRAFGKRTERPAPQAGRALHHGRYGQAGPEERRPPQGGRRRAAASPARLEGCVVAFVGMEQGGRLTRIPNPGRRQERRPWLMPL